MCEKREMTELELMQQAFWSLWLICKKHENCFECPMYAGTGCRCALGYLTSDYFAQKGRGQQ